MRWSIVIVVAICVAPVLVLANSSSEITPNPPLKNQSNRLLNLNTSISQSEADRYLKAVFQESLNQLAINDDTQQNEHSPFLKYDTDTDIKP